MIENFVKIEKRADGSIVLHEKTGRFQQDQVFHSKEELFKFADDLFEYAKKKLVDAIKQIRIDEQEQREIYMVLDFRAVILNYLHPEREWNTKLKLDIESLLKDIDGKGQE